MPILIAQRPEIGLFNHRGRRIAAVGRTAHDVADPGYVKNARNHVLPANGQLFQRRHVLFDRCKVNNPADTAVFPQFDKVAHRHQRHVFAQNVGQFGKGVVISAAHLQSLHRQLHPRIDAVQLV